MAVEADDRQVTRILVLRAGALGDTLMATPVVAALRERYSGAAIDFLASAPAAPLLDDVPGIDEVLSLRQRNVPYWLSTEKQRLVRRLRRARYSLAVALEQAPRYYTFLARAGIPRIIGFRDTPFDPKLHSIANNLRAAGFDDYTGRSWQMLVTPGHDPRGLARTLRGTHAGALVGFHVGYGPAGRKKDQEHRLRGWAPENFAAVGARLLEQGATIVLNGAPEDRPSVRRVAALLPRERVIDFTGTLTLQESVALIRHLDLLVSVDSGPAHIAAAVGTPLVVLWGPGILEQTRPISVSGPVEVLREPVPCAPCYGTPLMKACRRNICMEGIAPARVVASIESRLRVQPSLRPPA